MVVHTCYKCNKTFDKKNSYDYHMNKKFPCAPTVTRMDDLEEQNKKLVEEMDNLKLKFAELEKMFQNSLKLDVKEFYTLLQNNIQKVE